MLYFARGPKTVAGLTSSNVYFVSSVVLLKVTALALVLCLGPRLYYFCQKISTFHCIAYIPFIIYSDSDWREGHMFLEYQVAS